MARIYTIYPLVPFLAHLLSEGGCEACYSSVNLASLIEFACYKIPEMIANGNHMALWLVTKWMVVMWIGSFHLNILHANHYNYRQMFNKAPPLYSEDTQLGWTPIYFSVDCHSNNCGSSLGVPTINTKTFSLKGHF